MENSDAEAAEEPRKQTRRRNRRVDFDNLSKHCSKRLRSVLKESQGSSSSLQFSECDMTVPSAPQLQESNFETCLMESVETHSNLEDNVDIDADHCSQPLFTNESYVMQDNGLSEFSEESSDEESTQERHFSHDSEFTEEESNDDSDFDLPLYDGAEYSLGTVLLALMAFAMSHSISFTCLGDLLNLLKLILPKSNKLVSSVYQFLKYFEQFQKNCTKHYYCEECRSALHSKNSICDKCGPNTRVSYFLHVSIEEQVKKLLQVPGFYEKLFYNNTRVKAKKYEDIHDGRVYEEAKNNLFGVGNWITFFWNTDGFSLFRSSTFEIWPFYLCINELAPKFRFKMENLLLGGLWFGKGKPSPNLFLRPLLDELLVLQKGFYCSVYGHVEPVLIKVGLLAGTCDAPAKATFMMHKFFNGFFGCLRCLCKGEKSERTKNKFVYPFQQDLNLRTEENYLQHLAELRRLREHRPNVKFYKGIKGPTILKNLSISSLIPSISVDIMHNLFLGHFKTLMNLWFGEESKPEAFNNVERIDVVSHFLCGIRPPHCIDRPPQSLEKIKFWKASEYQSFFFFYCLPILSLVIEQVYFNHFKLLYLGIILLCQDSISEADLLLSQRLLDEYVEQFENLYGMSRMTYNCHMLRHLPNVVRDLGPLWTSSCFKFEHFNGLLKYLVHGTQYVGLQVQKNFELLTQIPVMLRDLQPSKLKDFCHKLSTPNARLRLREYLGNDMYIVGGVKKRENKMYFKQLRINGILFESASQKKRKKDSSFIRYRYEGQVHHGIVNTFVKNLDCLEGPQCFVIVRNLVCTVAFKTLHSDFDLFGTYSYILSDTVHEVPISDITGICVNVEVENNLYVIDFVNSNFHQ